MDGNMERAQVRVKRSTSRGETMVETIVAFTVLLLMLATVTAMLRFALNANNKAAQRMDALEAAETAIEKGEGTTAASDRLSVDMSGYDSVSIPIGIKESGELLYFVD